MKQLIYLMLCMVMLPILSCKQTIKENPVELSVFNDSVCYIKYAQKINGYDVMIKVSPFVSDDSLVKGTARILFFHGDTLMMVFHNTYFKLSYLNREALLNGETYNAKYEFPVIDYSKPFKLMEFEELPFFFLDVDFDDQPELILNYANQGQRWSNAYVAYGLQNYGDHESYDYLYDEVRNIPPFQNLDDLSEIDYSKKEISTLAYGGMSTSEKLIYRRMNDNIQLHRREEYDSLGFILTKREVFRTDTITTTY